MTTLHPALSSAPVVRRHPANPVLRPEQVPYPASLVFNAGVCRFQGRYVMVFRNDYGATKHDYENNGPRLRGTNLGIAFSSDGVTWDIAPKPMLALEQARELCRPLLAGRDPQQEIGRLYDPRLTVLGGRVYMCCAVDTKHGLRGGVAVTDDFEKWELLCLSQPDNRNMVLFPEKIGGRFARLDRPMPVYSRGKDRFDTWYSSSPDLRDWGDHTLVLAVEDVPFANDKTGPAAPPVKTRRGWLTTFHAVDRDDTRGKCGWESKWTKRYSAGLMLLDLHDPRKVVGLCRTPLLAPEAAYETDEAGGFRGHVIFPGGMILEDSGEVKIYYGGADTVECLATAHVDDLLKLCEPV